MVCLFAKDAFSWLRKISEIEIVCLSYCQGIKKKSFMRFQSLYKTEVSTLSIYNCEQRRLLARFPSLPACRCRIYFGSVSQKSSEHFTDRHERYFRRIGENNNLFFQQSNPIGRKNIPELYNKPKRKSYFDWITVASFF